MTTSSTRQDTVEKVEPALADRCVGLTGGLGLDLARIDLRLTAGGDAICFELTPAPATRTTRRHPGSR